MHVLPYLAALAQEVIEAVEDCWVFLESVRISHLFFLGLTWFVMVLLSHS